MNAVQNFVPYIDRSREYYEAQGYDKPYRWAHYDDIPFTALKKPLAESRVTVVTTAMPDDTYRGQQRRLAFGDLRNPPEALYTGELAWDQEATHTNDRESYLPIRLLNAAIDQGRLGSLAEHFYSVPTLYSVRHTLESDAPAIVNDCRENDVDIALLIPL